VAEGAHPPTAPGAPRVSFVVPTHRRPDRLREAVASVLAQTAPPHEVIVVTDVPDDATGRVVDDLDDPRVSVLTRTGPAGASASRNVGARAATGSHLAFLDDDDSLAPDYLERALGALAVPGTVAVATPVVDVWPHDRREVRRWSGPLDVRTTVEAGSFITGSNLVISADVFWSIGGFDESMRFQNDADLAVRLLSSAGRVARLADPLVFVGQHGDGRLTDPTAARADSMERFYDKHVHLMSWRTRRRYRYRIRRARLDAAATWPGRARQLVAMAGLVDLSHVRRAAAKAARTWATR